MVRSMASSAPRERYWKVVAFLLPARGLYFNNEQQLLHRDNIGASCRRDEMRITSDTHGCCNDCRMRGMHSFCPNVSRPDVIALINFMAVGLALSFAIKCDNAWFQSAEVLKKKYLFM